MRLRSIDWVPTDGPSDFTINVTREAALPQNIVKSAQWLETLRQWWSVGVRPFVLDFGHVISTDLWGPKTRSESKVA